LNDARDIVRAGLLAGSACVFWTPRNDHAHLGRNLVQALGRILADEERTFIVSDKRSLSNAPAQHGQTLLSGSITTSSCGR
jgi:hypothetical protein